jgi:hypothetical protein
MELDIAELDTAGRDELLEHWRSLIGVNRPQFAGGSKVSMDGAYGKK